MEEAISFFRAFELWIYLLLGLGGLYYLRKFILAWQELQGASFGLEREKLAIGYCVAIYDDEQGARSHKHTFRSQNMNIWAKL